MSVPPCSCLLVSSCKSPTSPTLSFPALSLPAAGDTDLDWLLKYEATVRKLDANLTETTKAEDRTHLLSEASVKGMGDAAGWAAGYRWGGASVKGVESRGPQGCKCPRG